MIRSLFATLLLCLAAFSPPVRARAATDFSGHWALAPAPAPAAPGRGAAGVSGDMGSGWGSPLTITQDANQLTVEYVFFGRGDLQPPLKFVYSLDGKETKNSVMMGRGVQEQRSKTAWAGDTLVITTMHQLDDPSTGKPIPVEVTQKLSLESATVLVVETTRGGVLGGPAKTTTTKYTKS